MLAWITQTCSIAKSKGHSRIENGKRDVTGVKQYG